MPTCPLRHKFHKLRSRNSETVNCEQGHIEFTFEILERLSLSNSRFWCDYVYLMKSLETRSVHLSLGLAKMRGSCGG